MNLAIFERSFVLTGPTASGKSALALDIAERWNAEIIAADSMTLYRGLNIGTAKPSAAERRRVPHHLVDVLDPWDGANVSWWLEQAAERVADIERRGKIALFVGGTPFYLKALLCGLFPNPGSDDNLRRELEAEAAKHGVLALHARLATVDAVTARRLHPNDVRRVVRALEVWHLTGKPLSEWQQQEWFNPAGPRFAEDACIALSIPREELYARIDARVKKMFDSGWIEEVEALRMLSKPLSREASQALGYQEISELLDGKRTLADTIAEIQLRTRQFAKRQLTWFRRLPGCRFADVKLTFDLWSVKMKP